MSKTLFSTAMTTALMVGAVVAPASADTTPTQDSLALDITNNVGKKDVIVVNNIPANATVKIYLGATDYVPVFDKKNGAKVGSMTASLAYDLPPLEAATGNVYVTITPDGAKKEGERVPFEYKKELKTDDVTLDDDNKVVVANNSGKDTVSVTLANPALAKDTGTGVRVGAAINIYDTEDNLLGTGKVAAAGKTATVTLANPLPEASGGKVLVAFANTNQQETKPVEVSYAGEVTTSTSGLTIVTNNGVIVRDNVTVTGLDPDKVATVYVYSADPTGLTAKEAAKIQIGSGTSKVTTVADPADPTVKIKESSALANLTHSKGYAGVFPELADDTKVYVTVTYKDEHTSAPVGVGVKAEKQTALLLGDAADASTGTVVITSQNNSTGNDLVTVKGAAVGAIIKVYTPDGTKVVGQATVAKPKAGEETLTTFGISKGFSANIYEADSVDAKYKVTVTNVNELQSEAKEFTAANALETEFVVSEDNTVANNNVTVTDTVVLTGLKAKSTVKVYSADPAGLTDAEKAKLVIGTGTTKLAKSTDATGDATVNISKGFTNKDTEGKVFVEVTEFNSVPAVAEISVPKEEVTDTTGATLTVVNGVAKDTVSIAGLKLKDTVKVYSGLTAEGKVDTKTLIGSATAAKVGEDYVATATISKKFATKLDASIGEVVYIVVQNDNKVPGFIKASGDIKNNQSVETADSADAVALAIPVELITSTPSLTFEDNKVTATNYNFNIVTGTADAFPLKATDKIKIYATEDAASPIKTITVSAAQVTAEKVNSNIALALADNTTKEFWYTLTSGDTIESAKVKSTAIFAKSDAPTVSVGETTAKKTVDITVADSAVGDIVKVYDGTRVIKTITVKAEGDTVIQLTGITMDNDYKVTVTSLNKAESPKSTAAVKEYVAQ